jgi:GNAT superfamily N-acetyltransferase
MTIRDLRPDELDFLGEMLYAALDWRGDGSLPPLEFVLAHPAAAIYHEGWGRRGDVALVAEEDGRLLGLTWCRLFTDAEHGEGYYDDETPEVAVAVVEDARGRGVGRALVEAMHERLRADGYRRASISVDLGNRSKRLAESFGYVEVRPGHEHGLMVLEL